MVCGNFRTTITRASREVSGTKTVHRNDPNILQASSQPAQRQESTLGIDTSCTSRRWAQFFDTSFCRSCLCHLAIYFQLAHLPAVLFETFEAGIVNKRFFHGSDSKCLTTARLARYPMELVGSCHQIDLPFSQTWLAPIHSGQLVFPSGRIHGLCIELVLWFHHRIYRLDSNVAVSYTHLTLPTKRIV